MPGVASAPVSAVVRALPPLVLGHAASVAVVVALATGAGRLVPSGTLRLAGAALLLGYAALLLRRRAHPRRVGMRLGPRGLFVWSFVAASAHGAGLMLLPVLITLRAGAGGVGPAHAHGNVAAGGAAVLAAHTVAIHEHAPRDERG